MIIVQFIAAFIGVIAFSINLEVPKKYLFLTGIVGALGWVVYLLCIKLAIPTTLAYFISALTVSIMSIVLSKILKVISTVFLMAGIIPIVPGIAMYEMIYNTINNDFVQAKYYLLQAILIAGGIALAIFIADSLKNMKIVRKKSHNEN